LNRPSGAHDAEGDDPAIYSPRSEGVSSPIAVRPQLPRELPPDVNRSELRVIELVISPLGTVESVKLLGDPRNVHDSMLLSAAKKKSAGERSDLEAGMAKLFCAEACHEIVTDALRVHGGYGYSKEYTIERLYRDAPFLLIGEGTSEIQKLVIGRELLERYKIQS
jgi:hypothetical protein